jgi:hypothetical protein
MKPEFSRQFFLFSKILKYQISWKSVKWQPSCSIPTDGWMDRHGIVNSHFAILRTCPNTSHAHTVASKQSPRNCNTWCAQSVRTTGASCARTHNRACSVNLQNQDGRWGTSVLVKGLFTPTQKGSYRTATVLNFPQAHGHVPHPDREVPETEDTNLCVCRRRAADRRDTPGSDRFYTKISWSVTYQTIFNLHGRTVHQ